MDTEKRLLPAGPMARRLRVSVRWIKAEADAGRLPCVKAETVYLFDADTVEAILTSRAKQGVQHAR